MFATVLRDDQDNPDGFGGHDLSDLFVLGVTYTVILCTVYYVLYTTVIQSHIKHIVQYTIQATMQIHALSAKQVSKEAPRLTCQ